MGIKIADLLAKPETVEVAPGVPLDLHPLSLLQIVELMMNHQHAFVSLYAEAQKKEPNYTQFLLAAPDFIAQVIKMGTDAEDDLDVIKRLPGTVQLIAIQKIYKLSVPDAKKLQELLSEATAALRQLGKNASARIEQQPQAATQEAAPLTPSTEPLLSA
jgi:hypothetical protein